MFKVQLSRLAWGPYPSDWDATIFPTDLPVHPKMLRKVIVQPSGLQVCEAEDSGLTPTSSSDSDTDIPPGGWNIHSECLLDTVQNVCQSRCGTHYYYGRLLGLVMQNCNLFSSKP